MSRHSLRDRLGVMPFPSDLNGPFFGYPARDFSLGYMTHYTPLIVSEPLIRVEKPKYHKGKRINQRHFLLKNK